MDWTRCLKTLQRMLNPMHYLNMLILKGLRRSVNEPLSIIAYGLGSGVGLRRPFGRCCWTRRAGVRRHAIRAWHECAYRASLRDLDHGMSHASTSCQLLGRATPFQSRFLPLAGDDFGMLSSRDFSPASPRDGRPLRFPTSRYEGR